MSYHKGFIKGGEHTDDVPQQGKPSGTGVVIVAPKQAAKASDDAVPRTSTILSIRKALQRHDTGRTHCPTSPAAGRRRASPSYEPLKPRGSPTYKPIRSRGSPSYEPASKAIEPAEPRQQQDTLAGVTDTHPSHSSSRSDRSNSRERHRHTSDRRRSKSRDSSRDRHKWRHRSNSRYGRRHRQRSRSSSSSRSRSRSSDRKSGKQRRRHSSRSDRKRHKHSRSRSRQRDSRHSSHRDRCRSSSRDRWRHSKELSSRDRERSASPVRFTRQEKSRAWAEEQAYNTDNPIRRGKQGLGFGQQQQQQHERTDRGVYKDDRKDHSRESSDAGRGKAVATLDASRLIPGYESMTAAEKLKARMRLVMSKAEQQSTAAEEAAAAAGAAVIHPTASGMHAAGISGNADNSGWTRFVFDQHGELDEDKQARQRLMDAEVGQTAMGGVGNAADDVVDTSAAFIMGTGRVAAQQAGLARAAEAAHEDAIFGRPYGGSLEEHRVNRSEHHKARGATVNADEHSHQWEQQRRESSSSQQMDDVREEGLGGSAHKHQQQRQNPLAELNTEAGAAFVQALDQEADTEAQQLAASLGVSEALIVEQQKPGLSWRERALAMKAKRQQ